MTTKRYIGRIARSSFPRKWGNGLGQRVEENTSFNRVIKTSHRGKGNGSLGLKRWGYSSIAKEAFSAKVESLKSCSKNSQLLNLPVSPRTVPLKRRPSLSWRDNYIFKDRRKHLFSLLNLTREKKRQMRSKSMKWVDRQGGARISKVLRGKKNPSPKGNLKT